MKITSTSSPNLTVYVSGTRIDFEDGVAEVPEDKVGPLMALSKSLDLGFEAEEAKEKPAERRGPGRPRKASK